MNTSMILFGTDASTYRESNIRWVPVDGVYEKDIVMSEWGENKTVGEEEAGKVFKFHCEVMKYLVATVIDVDEAHNFYYSVVPFEDIHGNISDVENLKPVL